MNQRLLPEGWVETNFDKVLEKISNGMGGQQNKSGLGFPVSRIETISEQFINFDKIGYIETPDKQDTKDYLLNKGDILFSHINSPTHLGKTAVYDSEQPLYHGINLLRLRVNNSVIHYKFFNYYCNLFRLQGGFAAQAQHAVNQASLNQKKIKSFPIPLPPLAEQHHIAKVLDDSLAMAARIRERLSSVQQQLKSFRQSVLADAVSGRLVGLGNCCWHSNTLKNITNKIGSGSTPKGGNAVYKSSGIPFVRSMNIYTDFIKYDDLAYIDEAQAEKLKGVEILKSDILINITGASIGRVNIAPDQFVGGRVNQHVAIIRCKQDLINPKFLKIYLSSPSIQRWVLSENYGATRQALSKIMLENLTINLPPLPEQQEIVRRVDTLFAHAEQVEQQMAVAMAQVEQLVQSLLAAAFDGSLSSAWRDANQALITGEHSAAALLAQITQQPPTKTRTKKSTKTTTNLV